MYSIGPQSEGEMLSSVRLNEVRFLNFFLKWLTFSHRVVLLSEWPGDYLGGEVYWAGAVHLYTPLPFRPGKGGFGDLFRTHFFLNAGNLCNLNYGVCFKDVIEPHNLWCGSVRSSVMIAVISLEAESMFKFISMRNPQDSITIMYVCMYVEEWNDLVICREPIRFQQNVSGNANLISF